MIEDCKFNPETDLQETVPAMSTDLAAALDTGVVVDTGTVGEFNEISDPSAVWCRVNDAIQAMEVAAQIRKYGRVNSAATGGSAAVSSAESTLAAKSE